MADIETGNKRLQRREVVRALLENRNDLLVVAGLGAPAWDVTDAGDHPLNFPLWGGMGGAVMIGIGLALAQPDRNNPARRTDHVDMGACYYHRTFGSKARKCKKPCTFQGNEQARGE